MRFRSLHRWDVSPARARAIQEEFRGRVRAGGRPGEIRSVAGADVSYSRGSDLFHAAVVVLDFPGLEPIAEASASGRVSFPYVPGLLSFREAPVLLRAFRRLRRPPDILLCDAQGIAHPRRLGLASHVGLVLDLPTIGCAKSRLVGEHGPVANDRGGRAPLTEGGEVIGAVVRTRRGVKPVFVSVGHAIGLDEAVEIVLACTREYRVPEPIRAAHHRVNEIRRFAEAGGASGTEKGEGKGSDGGDDGSLDLR